MDESEPLADDLPPRKPLLARLRRLCSLALLLCGGALLIAVLLSFTAPAVWWLDLFTHFQVQYALALLLVALTQLAVRPRWLAGAWLMTAAASALPLAPLYLGQLPSSRSESLKLIHCNTGGDGIDEAALAQWLKSESPDLILLQEVTQRNLPRISESLRKVGLTHELIVAEVRSDTRGVALFSGPGLTARVIRVPAEHDRPMIQVDTELSGTPLSILGFSATRPAPARPYRFQAEGYDGAQQWCQKQAAAGRQQLLIGDFNCTVNGALLSQLREKAGLEDARQAHGICATWPSHLPAPLRVPIDGAYHTRGLVATEMRAGPYVGSDHLPIFLTLERRAALN